MNVASILDRKGRDVATAPEDITLRDAARELRQRRIGALVILNEAGEIAGILSERDIVRAMADKGGIAADMPANQFMSRDICTCRLADTTEELMAIMTKRRFRHLPVIEGGRLAGIVSIGDVVLQRMEEMAFEAEQMKQYIIS